MWTFMWAHLKLFGHPTSNSDSVFWCLNPSSTVDYPVWALNRNAYTLSHKDCCKFRRLRNECKKQKIGRQEEWVHHREMVTCIPQPPAFLASACSPLPLSATLLNPWLFIPLCRAADILLLYKKKKNIQLPVTLSIRKCMFGDGQRK